MTADEQELGQVTLIQATIHAYMTPHPELGKDVDERGCVYCYLIARHLWGKGMTITPAPLEPRMRHA